MQTSGPSHFFLIAFNFYNSLDFQENGEDNRVPLHLLGSFPYYYIILHYYDAFLIISKLY